MKNKFKIIPLGGMGHVTKNMFLYEWGEERIIMDCGIGFPEMEMLGVDLLIPDISYLKGKEKTVKAIILTHGHDDHLGGLPYVLPYLPPSVPIYASRLTLGFAQDTVKEFGINAIWRELPDQAFNIGSFMIDSMPVTHSVPDARHFIIKTPVGTVYHGSDYKIDFAPVDKKYMDLQKIAWYGKQGIDLMLTDCLRIEKSGFTPSESNLSEVFEREISDCRGRFIITTMSSNIHRIQQAVDVMIAHRRKVAFLGRSVEENIKTAIRLNYFKLDQKNVVNKRRINKIPAKNLALIIAGSQGQVGSTLDRVAKNEYDKLKINPGDKIVFSTDVIPGNENYYYALIDRLSKLGAQVSYYDILDDLHVSGHASRGEQELMLALTKPKYVMPIGGTFRHMVHFKDMATSLGMSPDNVFLLEDNQTLTLESGKVYLGEEISLKTIIVDGLGIGDVGKVVLDDRKKMSDDGIVVIVLTIDERDKRVLANPEIITRGFVYVKKSRDFINALQGQIAQVIPANRSVNDISDIKEKVSQAAEQFIFTETEREPMILSVVIKV